MQLLVCVGRNEMLSLRPVFTSQGYEWENWCRGCLRLVSDYDNSTFLRGSSLAICFACYLNVTAGRFCSIRVMILHTSVLRRD